jgi:hypothetical protein
MQKSLFQILFIFKHAFNFEQNEFVTLTKNVQLVVIFYFFEFMLIKKATINHLTIPS